MSTEIREELKQSWIIFDDPDLRNKILNFGKKGERNYLHAWYIDSTQTVSNNRRQTYPNSSQRNRDKQRDTDRKRNREKETERDREREREGISDIFPDCKRGALRYGRNRSITRARHTIPNPEIGVTDTKRRIPKRTMSNGVRVCVCMRVQRGIVNVFEPVCCAVTLYVYIRYICASQKDRMMGWKRKGKKKKEKLEEEIPEQGVERRSIWVKVNREHK